MKEACFVKKKKKKISLTVMNTMYCWSVVFKEREIIWDALIIKTMMAVQTEEQDLRHFRVRKCKILHLGPCVGMR